MLVYLLRWLLIRNCEIEIGTGKKQRKIQQILNCWLYCYQGHSTHTHTAQTVGHTDTVKLMFVLQYHSYRMYIVLRSMSFLLTQLNEQQT